LLSDDPHTVVTDDLRIDFNLPEIKPIGPDNEQERYWVPIIGVWLAVNKEGILCYDETGNLLIDHQETTQALNEERLNHAQTIQSLEGERQEHAETVEALTEESKRASEQEQIAKLEAERAAEQERIAKLEAERAAEQERIAKEQEQIAKLEAERVKQAEDENARLRAIIAQMGGKA